MTSRLRNSNVYYYILQCTSTVSGWALQLAVEDIYIYNANLVISSSSSFKIWYLYFDIILLFKYHEWSQPVTQVSYYDL